MPSTSEPLAYPAIGKHGGLLLDAGEVLDIVDDGGYEPGRGLRGSLAPLGAVVVTGELVDDTLRAWPEVILRVWVIVDDQPVANVTGPTTVQSDSLCRTTEPLVEHFLHRMALRSP